MRRGPVPNRFRPGLLSCEVVYLEDLIAIVIDDLHGDATRVRQGEGPGDGRVQAGPGVGVDLSPESLGQALIGLLTPGEVSVPDEERGAVVVRVDEPAGDVVRRSRAHGTRGRVVHVEAVDLDDGFTAGH